MPRDLPTYVYRDVDRYGTARIYFKRRGMKIRLSDDPASAEFAREYRAALNTIGEAPPSAKTLTPPPANHTLGWLCEAYFRSNEFKVLDPQTQHVRKLIVGHCLAELVAPGKPEVYRDCPVEFVTPKAMKVLRDRKTGLPEAANGRIKAFRQIFAWALEDDDLDAIVKMNPARDVKYLRGNGDGFHPWSIEEVEQYEGHHQVGTTARLALALLLYLGQRRSDIVLFGRQHIRQRMVEIDGRRIETEWLKFRQWKNRNRKPVDLEIPIIPELRRIIDASPCGDLTFLVNELGNPFSAAGFGNRMRKWCDEAGLPECAAHGLRKASLARLAELGCTDAEMMSISGHTTRKEIDRYTKSVRQRRLAENVLRRIAAAID